ncbi:hypothetical protein [Nitrosomonas sp.]|uniref:hypothetical protein n=1 Tax=Nitrosomonas sp. TaxID=42353 RepID=UPI0026391445|nr:hypothetical protein [Nitrosomonas sp.]
MWDNAFVGIDLASGVGEPYGITDNDAGDADTGANDLQNFPVLSSAGTSGGDTTISGTLNSNTNTSYRIEFFSSPSAHDSDHGEASTYLGFTTVTHRRIRKRKLQRHFDRRYCHCRPYRHRHCHGRFRWRQLR